MSLIRSLVSDIAKASADRSYWTDHGTHGDNRLNEARDRLTRNQNRLDARLSVIERLTQRLTVLVDENLIDDVEARYLIRTLNDELS